MGFGDDGVHRNIERLHRYSIKDLEIESHTNLDSTIGGLEKTVVETSTPPHPVTLPIEGDARHNNHVDGVEVVKNRPYGFGNAKLRSWHHTISSSITSQQEIITIDTRQQNGFLFIPPWYKVVGVHLIVHRPIQQHCVGIDESGKGLDFFHDGL